MSILNVTEKVVVDNSVIRNQIHTHQPYSNRFDNNDEIRIPIQEDLSTLPGLSYLYIEGKLLKEDGTPSATAKFVNNGVAHLFNEIRYELNGQKVDSVMKPGVTSTLKGYVSYSSNDIKKLQNAGWLPSNDAKITDNDGNFNVCIPLMTLLGFFEDYKKIVLNIRQELVLIRSNTDLNAIINTVATEKMKVTISKIYWKVPHITAGLEQELALTKYIDKNNDTQVAFRSWDLHTVHSVEPNTQHSHAITTVPQIATPRQIICGFQTNRDGKANADMSKFDHCNIRNFRVFLNTEQFPYDNLQVDFAKNHYATLYEMYARFQHTYFQKNNEPLLTPAEFKRDAPIIVIDCSNQKEYLNTSSVVLRAEFETHSNVAADTTLYVLVLHDKVFTYNALTKAVKQL